MAKKCVKLRNIFKKMETNLNTIKIENKNIENQRSALRAHIPPPTLLISFQAANWKKKDQM